MRGFDIVLTARSACISAEFAVDLLVGAGFSYLKCLMWLLNILVQVGFEDGRRLLTYPALVKDAF
jgi:hypothetical protein